MYNMSPGPALRFPFGAQAEPVKVGFIRNVSGVPVFAMAVMAALVALACNSGAGFVVKLDDDRPLRVWGVHELPVVETSNGAPSLNSIVNISLQCKQYEDSEYKSIEACRSVPDDAAIWVVEVKGNGDPQTFDFGRSANIVLDWNSEVINLVERTTSNTVMKDVTEMIVTLK